MTTAPFRLKHTESAIRSAATVADPAEVSEYLQRLSADLVRELFFDVIQAGLAARNDTTEASAPTAAGVLQWNSVVHLLRTILHAKGWHIRNVRNCPLICAPTHHCALAVMTGDANTGRDCSEAPSNQTPKGEVARDYIEANRQMELLTREAREQGTQVWVLLYHYDKTLSEVRFELSLPVGFEGQQITAWETRLILGTISNAAVQIEAADDAQQHPATVAVTPKTGTR